MPCHNSARDISRPIFWEVVLLVTFCEADCTFQVKKQPTCTSAAVSHHVTWFGYKICKTAETVTSVSQHSHQFKLLMLHMHKQNQNLRLNLPDPSLHHENRSVICSSWESTIWGLSPNEQGPDLELKGNFTTDIVCSPWFWSSHKLHPSLY